MMIKTVAENQLEILENIKKLYIEGNYDCDLTYGNGSFWKNSESPKHIFDKQPLSKDVVEACSTNIPLPDNSIKSVVFDPPFLCYIKQGREHNSIMAKRFGGYWHYSELEKHYKYTLMDCHRVLDKKGLVIFKCQDIIHNHKLHSTHINIVNWSKDIGFRLKDMFILTAKHRMPLKANAHGRQTQRHARIYHSYFLVLEKQCTSITK